MNVKELIEKLKTVDGELEVFVSPMTIIEFGGIIGEVESQSNFNESQSVKIPDPESKYRVVLVQQASEAVIIDDKLEWYLILGFDLDETESETEEFVN